MTAGTTTDRVLVVAKALSPWIDFPYATQVARIALTALDANATEDREVWMCSRCESLRSAPIPHFAVAEEHRCPGEWVRGSWVPS